MIEASILLDSTQKVRDFSAAITALGAEGELVQESRILDARSVMGIFSLELTRPVTLRLYADLPALPPELRRFQL